MKSHSQYICQQCGYKSPSFLGKCPNCQSWNSLVETVEKESVSPWRKNAKREKNSNATITHLKNVKSAKVRRVKTGMCEVDQVLGGSMEGAGLVPGSVVLLAGDPGIGKSTLTLQIIASIGGLYVSGEESAEQVKLRAERLGIDAEKILILSDTNVETIIESSLANLDKINILIVDSIQTLWTEELSGSPGSVGQVRESTLKLLEFAKSQNVPMILIGHVTKEGTIAGPKTLEHIVDTVLYLEGERYHTLRLLRTNKNRFGPIDEVGVFSMEEKGLNEVSNPSELFLGEGKQAPGSVVVATLEGTRPLLVEVQALTVSSQTPLPRRVGTGINVNRLHMLIAILQKHFKLPLGKFDVFVNVASGIKVYEPAADLGICLAIISSFKNKLLSEKTVAIGEVGLLGEIRNVIGLERRVKEARKLGFKHIFSPKDYPNLASLAKLL